MSLPSAGETFQAAKALHVEGRLAEAETLYRELLAREPNHAQALHLLGIIAIQSGRPELAVALMSRTAALTPDEPEIHNDLGNALQTTGRLKEAIASYRRGLLLRPNQPDTHNNLGNALQRAGRLDEAIAEFREVLRLQPAASLTYFNLGNALQARGSFDEAVSAYHDAIRLEPDAAIVHSNLASALQSRGSLEAAVSSYQEAIRLDPNLVPAHYNLGIALQMQEKIPEAIASYEEALRLEPEYAEARNNLGNALHLIGRLKDAVEAFCHAIRIKPTYAEAHNNLGHAFEVLGKIDEAIACYETAIRLDPKFADPYCNLGNALQVRGRIDEAITAYHEAIRLRPEYAEAHYNLGLLFAKAGRVDEAIACYLEALRHKSDFSDAHNNLGNCYKDQGKPPLARSCYERALAIEPDAADIHSNLIFSLCFDPATTDEDIAAECDRWEQAHGKPRRSSWKKHSNSPDPDRPLRIGYVSPDLCVHVVGFQLLPLLREHDRAQFEIYCYSNVRQSDAVSSELQSLSNHWRSIVDVSDDEAAELIRADQIDILVDLALHTAHNQLPLFAHKPAPVQACWLGYCGTTGLQAMDYRLSDPYLDPPEDEGRSYRETTIRLSNTYWCYQPSGATPEIGPPPFRASSRITFGCLNNFAKISEAALDLWSEILRRTPDSRFLLQAPAGSCREAVRKCMAQAGIDPKRIEFVGREPWECYIETCNRIDIALDPLPYGGGITTCDALWMGAPVVTLRGRTAVGRGGSSILSNIGLPELIAKTPEQYLDIAIALANDSAKLTSLRTNLRERMEQSPLRNAKSFAQAVEQAFRQMWKNWCSTR